ncbi:hypothetical protein [Corynebacterium rouxii]|uniref:Uncharacterized protein n=1 Tax=Corynebacterium rouxii TaxID=2719119 RepID=A0ABU3PJS4_9CORY|nr:hypothetical protein [Corynebacterium rouxii]MDT9407912.1 hypothetical protein [Corynebacterium rouxii]MDT9410094.1 hypothetical protein [Corynebacterium rouxii]
MHDDQFSRLPPELRAAAGTRSEIIGETVKWVAAAWNRNRPMDPSAWFEIYAEEFTKRVTEAQLEAASIAIGSVDTALALQGYDGTPLGHASPEAFTGITGSGQPIMGLAYAQGLRITEAIDNGATEVERAKLWKYSGQVLQMATQTAISDASRIAKLTNLIARPRTTWVRIVRPPCCARCAILAGKRGGAGLGFQRHPGCDCDAIPVSEETSDMHKLWIFDVDKYFAQLSEKDQNKIFTIAGAQAIRDGADPSQVINARRGMKVAADRFGTRTVMTSEGTTKRGWASMYLRQQYDSKMSKRGRYMRTSRQRLMPEEIYKIAGGDRDIAVSLLHKNGFLLDASPTLDSKLNFFTRDKAVKEATERARVKLKARHEKELKRVTVEAGSGDPPSDPPRWSKNGGGDDEIRRRYFEDLRTADKRVPIEHIVTGKVHKNVIQGAHDHSRRSWVVEQVKSGVDLPSEVKTFFPLLKGRTAALRNWLGDEQQGIIRDVLSDPEEIEVDQWGTYRLKKEVLTPDKHRITLRVVTGKTRGNDTRTFKVNSAFPLRGGDGVTEVLSDGRIMTRYRKEE